MSAGRHLGGIVIARLVGVALLAAAGLIASTVLADAQAGTTLSIVPESASVPVDAASFQANLYVSGVTNETGLGGYDIYINYNPAIIQAVNGTDSGFIENTENIVVCVPPSIDNVAGQMILSCVTVPLFVGNGPTVPGQQLLATAVFKPVAAGVSALNLNGTSLTDPSGTNLPVTLQSSEVSVVQVQQQEPTATPAREEATATVAPTARSSPAAASAMETATFTPAATTPAITPTCTATPTPKRGIPETGAGTESQGGGPEPLPAVLGVAVAMLGVSAVAGGAFVWRRRRRSSTP